MVFFLPVRCEVSKRKVDVEIRQTETWPAWVRRIVDGPGLVLRFVAGVAGLAILIWFAVVALQALKVIKG
jgi:hypothetical protein